MDHVTRVDRRQFALGLIAGTTGLAPSLSAAAEEPKARTVPEDAPANASDTKPGEEPEKPDLPPEVLLLTYLVRRYPNEHFDQQAVRGIFRDIRGDVARSQALAAFPLANSDEPAFVFRPFRAGSESSPQDAG